MCVLAFMENNGLQATVRRASYGLLQYVTKLMSDFKCQEKTYFYDDIIGPEEELRRRATASYSSVKE